MSQEKKPLAYHLFPSASRIPDEIIDSRRTPTEALRLSRSVEGFKLQRKRSSASCVSSVSSQYLNTSSANKSPRPLSSQHLSKRAPPPPLPTSTQDPKRIAARDETTRSAILRKKQLLHNRKVVFDPNVDQVFMHLIHAKQQLRLTNNDSLNSAIAEAMARVEVEDRAEKVQGLLEEFHPFLYTKTQDLTQDQKMELCGRMAAVCLMSVRNAMRKGTVGDLGFDWDHVKKAFPDALHRDILDKEGDEFN